MDSSAAPSSAFDSFKSKKPLKSSISKPHSSDKAPDQNPLFFKTPEKTLTRRQSLRSVNQVKEAAKRLRVSDPVASVAPNPSPETPNSKSKTFKHPKSLPEKYEILCTFFDRLGSSLRLLGLKRSMPTFANISRMVRSLTDRSFGYSHLAQIKFILPEAVEIKKILVRDDRTSCLKPDLCISLNFDIVHDDENPRSDSGYTLLSKLFRSRLSGFCESNPEGDDVPEGELPEPFNKSNKSSYTNPVQKVNVDSVHDISSTVSEQQPVAASIMPQSFKRRFSKQILPENVEPAETRVDHEVASAVKSLNELPETPVKGFAIDGTPVKLVSTPFSDTPAQTAQPVRCFMTPDEEGSVMSPSKLTRRPSGKRSITFDTPVKNRTPPVKRVSTDDDEDVLSDDLLASIRANEMKVLEENNPEISQAKWRKQMIAGLPKLFDAVLFYFQSVKRTVVTKEELMNIITSSQLEIVDRREAEEQLRLLQEFAPELIYEKMASSGDLLICVNKISSPESIRTRLLNAN
ncbi:putative CDT1 Geminin-binding domain, DNA replication factor Cdt1 [Helianthus annuus]|nr:putative CDT1 Geminin-binding domain, DNA replication factor Cdt1 [Helianthus annuus]KAJ0882334.1 putative CDT1 Geminin-binding domain, DNA replication factor Cdt1 [Helianthus annuus]